MQKEQINNMLNRLQAIRNNIIEASNYESIPFNFFEKTESEILIFLKEFYTLKELGSKKDHLKYKEKTKTVIAPEVIEKKRKEETKDKTDKHKQANEKTDEISKPDIRVFLSLNDKYYFLRELFNQDKEKMNQVIGILNNNASLLETTKYLNEILQWDLEDPIVAEFLAIIEKRFL